jgi:hypothetical protein
VATSTTPLVEQRGEQPSQDHRISDIGDRELVKTKQPRFSGNGRCYRRDRIVAFCLSLLDRAPVGGDAVVHVRHEFVEVGAALLPERHDAIEHVHQHGLAAANAAMHVEPANRLRRLASGEHPADDIGLGCDARRGEFIHQPVEPARDLLLLWIARHLAALDEVEIFFRDAAMRLQAGMRHRGLRLIG